MHTSDSDSQAEPPAPQQPRRAQRKKTKAKAKPRPAAPKQPSFLDRMASDAARRAHDDKQRAKQWASVKQTAWVAERARNGVRPTKKALRVFTTRQSIDTARRREAADDVAAAKARQPEPEVLFVTQRTALRQPPHFRSTGHALEAGESVELGERRVHRRKIYAETERGWIAQRALSKAELGAAAARDASCMVSELLAGEHGQFTAIKPVVHLMRSLSSAKLAAVADAAVPVWQELAQVSGNTSQLLGLPRPPSDASGVGPWVTALGEGLTAAMRAGVPYALLGERLLADHRVFQPRQWTTAELQASGAALQRSFRQQLAAGIGGAEVEMDEASQDRAHAFGEASKILRSADEEGEEAYGEDEFEDDEENDVQSAANRSANMGAHEEERDRANFFSRLERDAVGRVERESGGSVHKPLASVTAEQRAEERFAPKIGPSWKKHRLGWQRWSLSDDVVQRMDADSQTRQGAHAPPCRRAFAKSPFG